MIYLASRYQRKDEMAINAQLLRNMGHKICSRWHDIPPDYENAARFDIADINICGMIVMFTENKKDTPWPNTGGRHFELGYAYHKYKEYQKPELIIVGEVENAFHLLPGIRRFSSWEDFLTHMEKTDEGDSVRAPT